MNKLALGLIVVSIAASSFITYQVTQSQLAGQSGQSVTKDMLADYITKEGLNEQFGKYLDENAEKVFAAVAKGVALQKQAEVEKKRQALLDSKDELENDARSPVIGNEKGDVTIVMFSDYSCGYCKRSAPVLEKLLASDTGLKLVVKEFPVLGPASIISAKAALAVFTLDKSKYEAFHKSLFETELSSEVQLIELAESAGLDAKALLAEMAKPEYDKLLEMNHALATSLGINGTPAFVIDGALYPGAMPEDQFVSLIEHTRSKRAAEPAPAPAEAAAAQ